ncbi:beta-galactosidase GalA [Ideonella sp.]|uniref:beta-galactosidase GalA n=1 Tax=Ideonella sp. TaxID=1929293 RepID=UPI002B46BEF2|nr:beta-galactosidase GalA [Ideonella sp.]HJV68013.1 beta-galactosidase GalA [Ideonella sp.]
MRMLFQTLCLSLRTLLCVAAIAPSIALAAEAEPRERLLIDDGWRFAYGHAWDAEKDFRHGLRAFFFAKAGYGDGPAEPNFDDRAWRRLDLPHDWAVELPFDSRGDTNHGSKALGRPFPENSVGWYRRELAIPATDQGRRIAIELDGVFRDSVVWVNGHYIGREHSGYASVRYDISSYLNYGGRNVVAVRVDATGTEGWWYEGAGIYRHVWLSKTGPLHVGHWGTFVRAEVKDQRATLTVDATVVNDGPQGERFALDHEVLDPDGRRVATRRLPAQAVGADSKQDTRVQIDVPAPRLWSLQTPQRYTLVTRVRRGGQVVDRYETPFGIRTLRFDADQGFFLNGEQVKLHGTDNHQDHAGVGIALPDALHDWRLRRLKEMGVNAIRSAHHPATPELLDACDRLGLLVIDEHRVMGTAPEIRHELERLVRRDRNHPSVILWSVGNEEWAIENTEIGTRLAREMQAIVKRMDATRGLTLAASSSGGPEGTAVGSEILGFNYKAQHDIDAMHKRFPERPVVVTEEGLTFATRGIYADDPARVHVAAYDKPSGGASTASIEQAWRFNAERPYIAGMFVWTGFDYRGETTPYGWPAISSQFGMLDTTGAFKDSGWYLKAAWTKAPVVHLLPHWNWPGKEGQPIDVRVYGNTEEIELLQDGRSLGRQPLARYGHLQWSVPYAPGELTARGFNGGRLVASQTVATTGPAHTVSMTTDRTTLRADGRDVAVLELTVRDAQGRIVPLADNELRFDATGPLRLLGMGNGDPGSHEADKPADRYRFAPLRDWAIRDEARPEALADAARAADAKAWRDPFQWLPEDKRPAPAPYHALRMRFPRPAMAAGERMELFVAEIVPGQQLYLNGAAVATRPTGDGRVLVEIDPARLKDENELLWHLKAPASGLQPLVDAAQAGARWAQLRVTTPAGPWQRRVFNGRAQLIVQSTGATGRAVVTASGAGLETARLQIDLH